MLPFNTVSIRGSSLPGYCQKMTIILQAISLKLIQTRKHNIATPNSECRGLQRYVILTVAIYQENPQHCVICCCAALQHNFIWKVQSARLLPESDNKSTSNFFKTYSNMQHWIICQIYCCLNKQAESIGIEG